MSSCRLEQLTNAFFVLLFIVIFLGNVEPGWEAKAQPQFILEFR